MLKDCKYRLPCNWCDKYDRLCLHVEYEITKQESEKYSEPTECNHDWVLDETRIHTGGEDRYYHCRHCGAIKLDNSHGVSYESGEWKP